MSLAPFEMHWVQQPGTRVADVLRPTTLAEAAELLAESPELRPVAGGTDLMLDLARDGLGSTANLLDLSLVHGLDELNFSDPAKSVLGAGITHADILATSAAHGLLRPLAQACLEVGSPQLRNRATVVGNLVTASPANDTISALLALGASVSIVSHTDTGLERRMVALEDFYTGFRQTVLGPTDLVEALHVRPLTKMRRGIWVKAGLRKAQAISVVHAGFVLDFDNDGNVSSARIALGSVGPTVALSEPAADALVGSALSGQSIAAAANAAVDSVSPIDDGRATAEYRNDAVVTVVTRALEALATEQEHARWPARVPLLSLRGLDVASAPSMSDSATLGTVRDGDDITAMVNGTLVAGPTVGLGSLLDWLREYASLGTKEGCAEGECGACTVQLGPDAVMSCLVPAAQAGGSTIVTIEGLGEPAELNAMQTAFVEKFAVQCGYCIPGFVMAAETLSQEFDRVPSREEIELALSGNLCRCTGYYNIISAVEVAINSEPRGTT